MPALSPAVAGDGLAVGDAGNLRRRLDAIFTFQLLEDHVAVNVSQPCDHELMSLLEPLDVQRRILFAQPRQAAGDLLLVATGFGGDGHAVGSAWQLERRQRTCVLLSEGVAGEGVSQLCRGPDVARMDLGCGRVLLAAWKEDLGQPFVSPS